MRVRVLLAACLLVAPLLTPLPAHAQAGGEFTLEQVMGAPYPTELTASGERIAWTLNARGQRNIWVAEGPTFEARRLTGYIADDGQAITSVRISADGRWVVYVRGGDFGSNWDDALPVNPMGMPMPTKVEIWTVPFDGGTPVSLGEGENPVISPRSDVIVFERNRQLWQSPIDGSSPARRLMELRGSNGDAQFSPDGRRIAFVSNRGTHAFIGIYMDADTPITWIAPSTNRDFAPRWSRDGRHLVFARRRGVGGAPADPRAPDANPWSIWVADASRGTAEQRWASDTTARGSVPSTHGGVNLHVAAQDRIVFLSYQDGWPHLYAMPMRGRSAPVLLTPGDHMAEHITLSPDGRFVLYSGNTGRTAQDIDRRHIVRAAVDRPGIDVLTQGDGLEWTPVALASGKVVAIGATPQRPPVPFVLDGSTRHWIGDTQVPSDFPTARLVTPTQAIFTAEDGVRVHAQLFTPPGDGAARRPAIVYVHGGPPRQMLLGWHYGDYYWNAYLMNQYLASRGFVVLAVNYRLGIGYGHDFHRPPASGAMGASEYRDIKAAAEYLKTLPAVDPARIGIYGGSYGGFLTALALGRNSDLFAAGVDIHGVHDFTVDGGGRFGGTGWRFERSQAQLDTLARIAWESSPVSSVGGWRSPVLLIHGDDDRNVRVSQTVDLVQRLRAQGVTYEELLIPDDTHHWMRWENQWRVNTAIAAYLERQLRPLR